MSFPVVEQMGLQERIHHPDGLPPSQGPAKQAERTSANASRIATVENQQGLHMRPVAQFVDLANQFRSSIQVKKGKFVANGKDSMDMMLLEATQGTELEIVADGPDAADAADALAALVRSGFGEA